MNRHISIPDLLENSYKLNPEKEALYDGYNRFTYKQLFVEAHSIASGLTQIGLKKGDRVMVVVPNWNEFVPIFFGLASIGAILIPCNTRYNSDELMYILENSGAIGIFVTEKTGHIDFLKDYLKDDQNLNSLEHIITVRFKRDGYFSYNDLLEIGEEVPFTRPIINPVEDIFAILYTSGTTGKQKGVMLTHQNFIYSARITNEKLLCTPEDVFLVAVPVFHVFGMASGLLSAIAAGAKIVFMENYKALGALELIEKEKITVHHGVPTMFILELNHLNFEKYDLSSLRTGIIAAAPCPEEIVRKIRNKMFCNIMVFYGLTESTGSITATSFEDDDNRRSVTVGKVLSGSEAKVVDKQRNLLLTGGVGELALRGPGIMMGYYQMPDKTKEAFDEDGWFYTGDLAIIDENGYIRIVGRQKEMIIRGGFNIYPTEIEEVYYRHPSVLKVAIVGLPDTVLGEVSCAVIELKPGYCEDEKSMKAYISKKIADFKVPDRVVFVEKMPMTASGKIKKVALEKAVIEQLKETLR